MALVAMQIKLPLAGVSYPAVSALLNCMLFIN